MGTFENLAEFIRGRQESFKNTDIEELVFVCGNEAGDLDSIVSSITYAYLQNVHQGKLLVPFVNISTPKVLNMRGEIQLVLAGMGTSTKDLLFLEQIFTKVEEAKCPLEVILIDHNEISGRWTRKYPGLQFHVIGIIDHHEDAGLYQDANPRIITTCGSTASLIYKFASSNDSIMEKLNCISLALLQTIIYDTVNLTWRQRPLDIEAVERLSLAKYKIDKDTDVSQIGKKLMSELEDAIAACPESSFSILDLLYKDYKLYIHTRSGGVGGGNSGEMIYYGISVLHLPFSEMIGDSREKLIEWIGGVGRFMEEEELKILLMTNSIREPGAVEHYQQTAIFTKSDIKDLKVRIYNSLQRHQAGLTEIVIDEEFGLYNQSNLSISRKQLHPIIKDFMMVEFP